MVPREADGIGVPRLVMGLAVMGFGVLLTLQQMGLIEGRHYLRYWPVLLIAYGVARVVESVRSPSGYIWALVGLGLLLDKLHVVDFFHFFWPAVFVIVGFSILRTGRHCGPGQDPSKRMSGLALMGGVSRKSTSDDFRGGEFAALMGGVEVDLRGAKIQGDEATIEAFAFWGGVEIWVPTDWQVISKGVALMGGFEDNSRSEPNATKRLVVRGLALMGGVEIKNREQK